MREAMAYIVVRGRVRFTPPRPGGRCLTVKHFPQFRQTTPGIWEYLLKNKRILVSVSVI
jgi:hypothetical protein